MKSGFIKKIEDINLFQISFISYKKNYYDIRIKIKISQLNINMSI